jgi:hypothetical protein
MRVRKVDKERTVDRENPVRPDNPAFLVVLRWRFAPNNRRRPAGRVHLATRDRQEYQENPEILAPTDNLATLERTVETDHPDQLDHPGLRVNPEQTDRRDRPAIQPSVFQLRPEIPDQPERTVHLARPAVTAPLVPMDNPAQLETKAHPDHPVLPETMVLLATRDRPALTDPRESGVFAPNIVPPMAACSSRMAQGDKRSFETLQSVLYSDEKPVILSIVSLLVFIVDSQLLLLHAITTPLRPRH